MTVAWVLGSGGLLGAALCRVLRSRGTPLFSPAAGFNWTSGTGLAAQMEAALQTFAARAVVAGRWEIYWAAGVGTMGSPEEALAAETRALVHLLQLVESEPRLVGVSGAVALASSAGAIYAGSRDDIITENTQPGPTTAYAREKLKQEAVLEAFVASNARVQALVARISTLYGPGQSEGKKQGLLAHIARSMLRNQPIQIYVPYDTLRDYIFCDDAAAAIVNALPRASDGKRFEMRIVASEHPVTIAEIVSIFKRIARRAPRVVTSASKLSQLYSRRVQFRSTVEPGHSRPRGGSLVVGIARLMSAERAAYARASNASRVV